MGEAWKNWGWSEGTF